MRDYARNKRILVVDDEEATLFALKKQFRTFGIEVDTAASRDEAMDFLREHVYDIIITDLRLAGSGGREGLDIIEHVKQKYPSTNVILLTAYGNLEVMAQAYKVGASFYLEKPVAFAELRRVLETIGMMLSESVTPGSVERASLSRHKREQE